MGRREGPSEERRAAILAAAEQAFAERGYSGASIREIARKAQVSSALLYWFFPDKAALFVAVLTRRLLEEELPVFFPREFLDMEPVVFLPLIALRYLEGIGDPAQMGLLRIMLQEGSRDPELIGRLAAMLLSRVMQPFRHYMERQAELGRMRGVEPDLAAQAFFGMMISFVLRRDVLMEPTIARFSNEQIAAAATDIFLHGTLGSGPGPDLAALKPVEREPARRPTKIELED